MIDFFNIDFPSERVFDAYISPNVDESKESFSWAVPNFVEISDYAKEKFGWNRIKAWTALLPGSDTRKILQ